MKNTIHNVHGYWNEEEKKGGVQIWCGNQKPNKYFITSLPI
jgi:hypothetical protein